MRLDSARDLKTELLTDVVTPFLEAATAPITARAAALTALDPATAADAARGLPIRAQRVAPSPEPLRSVALGVAPGRGKAGYRLAVRVQRQGLIGGALLERIERSARGEVDVRVVGRITARPGPAVPWHYERQRPLLIGSSVGHPKVTAGTLGGFVRRGTDGLWYILSNNHVLANENDAKAGDPIRQPGTLDGGRAADAIGVLGPFVRMKRRGANLVDSALACVNDGIAIDPCTLRDAGRGGRNARFAGLHEEEVTLGLPVVKVGRTTGTTIGRVSAIELDNVVVAYEVGNLRFDDQLEIESTGRRPFSDGGDSGSLIVTRAGARAVAQLFAGSDSGGRHDLGLTFATPIRTVLDALGARFEV